jgi:UDP-N-acetylglucosamine diphosphorylase/glucosamine-1-phosphate N-acetyltransferase
MKCVILAAGEGKRMHPLTYTRPKVMLPIAGKPILEWNLINAIHAGLKDFLFIISYKSEMVRDYFQDGKKWNVKISYINQGKPLGTAHAISMVESFADDFVVLCGDTIFGAVDIKSIMKPGLQIGVTTTDTPSHYGVVDLDGAAVRAIHEKEPNPISNIINAGIYHFDKTIFTAIKATKTSSRGEFEITDSMNILTQATPLHAVTLMEWRDVVYPWHLLDANKELLDKQEACCYGTIDPKASLQGPVFIGRETKILAGACIEGPVYIGSHCKIGPNCYIRPSTSIGDYCHVGNACEVKNSIIMDHSNVPHQGYVGDSVIGQYCNLGAGTKIANLRLDKRNVVVTLNGKKLDSNRRKLGAIIGDNVQTGINSMINIGSLIGNDVFLGPGASAKGELMPNTKIW